MQCRLVGHLRLHASQAAAVPLHAAGAACRRRLYPGAAAHSLPHRAPTRGRSIVSPVEGGDVFAEDYPNGFLAASSGPAATPCAPVALPPQLAQLAQLDWLHLFLGPAKCPVAGIPTEWWQPGAFPRLKWCAAMVAAAAAVPPSPVFVVTWPWHDQCLGHVGLPSTPPTRPPPRECPCRAKHALSLR